MNVYYIGDCGHFVFLPNECQTCKGNGAAESLYKRIEELAAELAKVRLENLGLRSALDDIVHAIYSNEATLQYVEQKARAALGGGE